ncbi:MAG: aldehyde dehydrogenase family protein [Acidimicrobiales bacterium]
MNVVFVSTKLGPVASQAQWDRLQGYIAKGVEEGATLVTGSAGRPPGYTSALQASLVVALVGALTLSEQFFSPIWVLSGLVAALWRASGHEAGVEA